ncbi:hypothetical protein FOA52_008034 [Chlamydomonas sp. UWO 241]|nr:hypothetical protein FOA52_008034 [Chlamydomonas sp. UWO 241]
MFDAPEVMFQLTDADSVLLVFDGEVAGRKVTIMIDSGASTQFVSESLVHKLALPETEKELGNSVRLANGDKLYSARFIELHYSISTFYETETFHVLNLDTYDLVLGRPWPNRHNPDVDWPSGRIQLTKGLECYTLLARVSGPLETGTCNDITPREVAHNREQLADQRSVKERIERERLEAWLFNVRSCSNNQLAIKERIAHERLEAWLFNARYRSNNHGEGSCFLPAPKHARNGPIASSIQMRQMTRQMTRELAPMSEESEDEKEERPEKRQTAAHKGKSKCAADQPQYQQRASEQRFEIEDIEVVLDIRMGGIYFNVHQVSQVLVKLKGHRVAAWQKTDRFILNIGIRTFLMWQAKLWLLPMTWSGVIGDAEALLASSRGGLCETVRHAQRLLGSLRAACGNTASHAQLTSRADRQQALRVLGPAPAMVQALGRTEPAALVAMRSLFLDLLPRLMHMPTEDGSVLKAAMGGDVVLFTHVQAAALAVSAPLLKLMLPLAASCLPVMMTTGGPAPLLALTYDVCRDSTTHGVVGPAAWHAPALVALVTNGVRAVLLSAADMEDEEAEELDACLELVAGLGPDLARWVAASGVANANVPAPCAVIFQTWVVCLQDSQLDGEGGDWSASTCARLFRAIERVVVGAGGSPAFLAAAITQCLSSIIAIAAASGSGSTEFFAGGAHDERQRPACAAALRVVRVLGAFPGFQTGVLLELLDLHAAANRKAKADGPLVLHMLSAVHAGDTPALVLALSCLLKPESNAAVETRLQVLAAMEQAVGARLQELAPDEGDQALELWPPEAVSTLSFSVLHDQAVTVRRSAMRLFSLVALPASRAAPLVRLLVAKPDGAGPAQIKPTANQLLFAGLASLGALGGCGVHPVELLLSLDLDEGVLEGALVQLQVAGCV